MYAVLHNINGENKNTHTYINIYTSYYPTRQQNLFPILKNATHILLPALDYYPKSIHLSIPIPPRRA